jgi:hypothetical protein
VLIKQIVSILESPVAAERRKVIEWLSPLNFFLRHADISNTRQRGTGGWLLADSLFEEWESGSRMTLWCSGMRAWLALGIFPTPINRKSIAGAGKTVLMYDRALIMGARIDYFAPRSMVVDYLRTKYKSKNIGVACIYLNHKEADNQMPWKLMAGLWRQLVLDKDIGSLAMDLYKQHHDMGTAPSLEEVIDVLHRSFAVFSTVYIIVDAIDEYPESQRWILLQHLARMGPIVNLMITSRPHITPDPSLPNLDALEICANGDDVRKYVDGQIWRSPRLLKLVQARPELRGEIHSKVTDKVDGM